MLFRDAEGYDNRDAQLKSCWSYAVPDLTECMPRKSAITYEGTGRHPTPQSHTTRRRPVENIKTEGFPSKGELSRVTKPRLGPPLSPGLSNVRGSPMRYSSRERWAREPNNMFSACSAHIRSHHHRSVSLFFVFRGLDIPRKSATRCQNPQLAKTTYLSPSNSKTMDTPNFDDSKRVLEFFLPSTIMDVITALFIGACLTLGTICLILLSSPAGGPPIQRRLLQVYIVALIIVVIGYFLSNFLFDNGLAIFRPHTKKDDEDLEVRRLGPATLGFQSIVIWMVDGLLVWRCFMVQKAFIGCSSPFQSVAFLGIVGLWATSFGGWREFALETRRQRGGATGLWAPYWSRLQSIMISVPSQVALGRVTGQYNEEEVVLAVENKLHNVPEITQIPGGKNGADS
ncbi:hypothetical protein P691DRAFT_787810 [Macrolepiota fuliginosa MF-IS2]|uniref:Uncharacterized protein n=1 Tax=Macrolepiota fuliginosa MF-IS2 TaxID=1400762 RepID=A0A9P5X5M8_9AGAR|nr:hypothetical protein P691DRAFT_787810 [Macrolepiota fuliginosa MF-IS2]